MPGCATFAATGLLAPPAGEEQPGGVGAGVLYCSRPTEFPRLTLNFSRAGLHLEKLHI